MAAEPSEFEIEVVRNCPSDATHYYLTRFGQKNEYIRFPSNHALRIRSPFEQPIECKPGVWLLVYTSDALGNQRVQHTGSRPYVEIELRLPASVCEGTTQEGKTTQELAEMLAAQSEIEDDAEGSLKSARIDAKKRELALEIASKEQKLLLRSAKNKEIAEGYLLNRSHRQEVRAQSEAMYKLQHQSVEMLERNFVLMEKMQESFGRFAEMEKSAAQRTASPPPPVDYSPVLGSVVSAIRDIGVSALQRDERKKLTAGDEPAPVKAALSEKGTSTDTAPAAKESAKESFKELPKDAAKDAASGPPASSSTDAPPLDSPIIRDLLAKVERMQEKTDRLQAELATERKRQRVLDEISARPDTTRPSSARESHPARQTLSDHRTPRNVPVNPREPSARSSGSAQPSSSPRPTSRNVQSGASDAAQASHPAQPHPSGWTSHSGQRDSSARSSGSAQLSPHPTPRNVPVDPREPSARSSGSAQPPSSSRSTSRNVQPGASDAARVSHPAQPHPPAQTSQSVERDPSARSYGSAQQPSSPRPTSRNVQAGASDAAQVSHPAQPMPSARTLQAGSRERLAPSASTLRPGGNAKPASSDVAAHAAQGPASPHQVQSAASTSTSSLGRNAKPARQDLAGERSQASERQGSSSSDPHSSPHAPSRQSGLTARWARRHKSCPCGSGRRYKHCCMYRSLRPESTQSPPARDAKQNRSASPPLASASSQLPAPKAPAQAERTREATKPQPELPPAPPHASTAPGQGSEVSAAAHASQAAATPASAKPESPPPTFPIPTGGLRHEVQGLLVNMLAGDLLDETDTPIPRPRVAEVKPVAPVVVEPSQLDPETAQRLLADGTTLESMGAYLLFNPAIGSQRRGK